MPSTLEKTMLARLDELEAAVRTLKRKVGAIVTLKREVTILKKEIALLKGEGKKES